jgi:hypothetical protein
MSVNRRTMIAAGLGLNASTAAAHTVEPKPSGNALRQPAHEVLPGLQPNVPHDQTRLLQTAIDAAAAKDAPLVLPPGTFRVAICACEAGHA